MRAFQNSISVCTMRPQPPRSGDKVGSRTKERVGSANGNRRGLGAVLAGAGEAKSCRFSAGRFSDAAEKAL